MRKLDTNQKLDTKRTLALFGLLALLMMGLAGGARAQTWGIADSDTFSRTATSVGAANTNTGVSADAYGVTKTDIYGGVWSLTGTVLQGKADGTNAVARTRDTLLWPSIENGISQRMVAEQVGNTSYHVAFLALRYQPNGARYSFRYDGGNIYIYSISGTGASTQIVAPTAAGFTAAHALEVEAIATGSSPTTLTFNVYDVTADPTAYPDPAGHTPIKTITATDSTAGIQTSGAFGLDLSEYPSQPYYTYNSIRTYLPVGMSASPSAVPVNTAGNVVSLFEPGAAWTTGSPGSPAFTLSGGTGASITAQTITGPNTAAVTLSAGSATGNLTVTDPATSVSATVAVSPYQVLPATDANLVSGLSPYNWYKGPGYVIPLTAGAYGKVAVTGTTAALVVDVSALVAAGVSAANYPILYLYADSGLATTVQLTSATTTVPFTLNASYNSYSHDLYFRLQAVSTADRWTGPADVHITGLQVDSGSATTSLTTAPSLLTKRPKVWLAYGDSISEGINVLGAGGTVATADAGQSYIPLVAQAFNAEYGQVGYQQQGWAYTGQGNVPIFINSWSLYFAGQSRLANGLLLPQPDYISVMEGNNDNGYGTLGSVAANLQSWLTAVRAAAPAAKIFVIIPFADLAKSQLTSGFNAYQSATPDANAYLVSANLELEDKNAITYGASFASSDGVHPYAAEQAKAAAQLVQTMQSKLVTASIIYTGGGQIKRGR